MTNDQETRVPLEERLRIIEQEQNQGSGFSALSWGLLVLTGIVGPALILLWGAS